MSRVVVGLPSPQSIVRVPVSVPGSRTRPPTTTGEPAGGLSVDGPMHNGQSGATVTVGLTFRALAPVTSVSSKPCCSVAVAVIW